MSRILIVGGTENIGREVVSQLAPMGRPPRTFLEWAAENAGAFSGEA